MSLHQYVTHDHGTRTWTFPVELLAVQEPLLLSIRPSIHPDPWPYPVIIIIRKQ
jgi:hypothetical protein